MNRRACASALGRLGFCWVLLATGCANITTGSVADVDSAQPRWQGRLAVNVAGDTPQAFSASFLLIGSATRGTLTLSSVLGTSLATLHWQEDGATLTTPQSTQQFASVDAMVAHSVGTPLPIATLFAWLQGDASAVAGWQVDLQSRAQGRIKAWRLAPDAAAEIKIILDPG